MFHRAARQTFGISAAASRCPRDKHRSNFAAKETNVKARTSTSNVFAILGLRSLYFALAGVMDKFHYLKIGLGVVLAFVGVKMVLIHTAWKIDTLVSSG